MLQPVLEDRFSLHCHWEKRLLPTYTLKVSGKNANLKDVTSAKGPKTVTVGEATISAGSGGLMKTANGRVVARGVTIQQLASFLADEQQIYVVDGAGLTGKYDFDMQLPQAPERSSFTANDDRALTRPPNQNETNDLLQDGLSQIGLKLVPSKTELPVLVIDELKPPSPN
jgi:uncharacterized protein (TIGR03435 family)